MNIVHRSKTYTAVLNKIKQVTKATRATHHFYKKYKYAISQSKRAARYSINTNTSK